MTAQETAPDRWQVEGRSDQVGAGSTPTVALTVRVRVDLSGLPAHHGWVTDDGRRAAMHALVALLAAPSGVDVVVNVGLLHPLLIGDDQLWRELLARYRIVVESADPALAREWHDWLSGVRA